MGIRFRIFVITFLSIGLGIANSNISLIIVILLFIAAAAASAYFANFTYKSINELETAISKIASGKTKKKYIQFQPQVRLPKEFVNGHY